MSRTIPRSLLPHRLDWQSTTPTADGLTYAAPIEIPSRVEPKAKLVYLSEGKSATATALIFLPPHVLVPDPDPLATERMRLLVEPQVDDRLTHGTTRYRVLEVVTLVNIDGSVHHHEVWAG